MQKLALDVRALCAASMALALVDSMPDLPRWKDIDNVRAREKELLAEESDTGHGLFVASKELDDGELAKKALQCVREFGPRGITTKAPKNKPRPNPSPARRADPTTRLQVRIARTGVCHASNRVEVPAPFTLSMSETAIAYARLSEEGNYFPEKSKADIRFLQLVRDSGELLVSQAWRRSDDSGFVKPSVHLATAVLLRGIGLAEVQPPADTRRCMAQLLALFVWALTECMHADIVSRTPKYVKPRHKACAQAVARAWEFLFFCRRHGWPDDAAVEAVYMSVLACLPRALLDADEPFDAEEFATCLQAVKIRPRSEADPHEPATPTEVCKARLFRAAFVSVLSRRHAFWYVGTPIQVIEAVRVPWYACVPVCLRSS